MTTSKRSLEQNDLFHPLCRDIAKHLTEGGAPTSEQMVKELVLAAFAPRVEYSRGGLTYEGPKRSHALTVREMSDLITQIEAWVATDL